MKFEVGDRVIVVKAGGLGLTRKNMIGWEGEVIRLGHRADGTPRVGVRFDEKHRATWLHNCDMAGPENLYRCWYCQESELGLINNSTPDYSENDWATLIATEQEDVCE